MQLHQIKPQHKPRRKYRIGRGGKRGTYCGRGIKGQKSRAGGKLRPAMWDIVKRIPKKRGYRFKSFRLKPQVLNLEDLEKRFRDGETVSPKTLLEKGLIVKVKGRMPEVKILGKGKLKKKLKIEGCKFSKRACQNLLKK